MIEVAVIIPFFQRDPGILRRAVVSILDQALPVGVSLQIIIVDDGSPLPARQDIEGLIFSGPFKLSLIEQKNGGCGAARDAGLKAIKKEVSFVAFLDSDDSWHADHIHNALISLDKGFDFYFTDHSRVDCHESFFKNIHFPEKTVNKGELKQLDGDVWSIDKDRFFNFAMRRFTAQISTIVYRRSIHPMATFQTSLKAAAEDYIFILELIRRSSKICFSNKVEVTCGRGINIYYSTFGWNDEGHLRRYMADILGCYATIRVLQLHGEDKKVIQSKLDSFRKSFAFFSLRWFLQRRGKWSKELCELTSEDPDFIYWYPWSLIYVAVLYPLGFYKASYHVEQN